LLDTITGSGQVIAVDYDYPNPSPTAFPAAYLILTSSSEETETTAEDTLTSTFIVRLQIQALWTSAGYTKALTCIDSVLTLLRKSASRTGSGTIYDIKVSPNIRVIYTDTAQGKMIFADITVDVCDLILNG
jgi:hypothetical protein